jgi:hypothetical protein
MHWHGLFWPELELAIGTAKIFFKNFHLFCYYVGSFWSALQRVHTPADSGRMANRIRDPGPFLPYLLFVLMAAAGAGG